jgi:hypothetical protein
MAGSDSVAPAPHIAPRVSRLLVGLPTPLAIVALPAGMLHHGRTMRCHSERGDERPKRNKSRDEEWRRNLPPSGLVELSTGEAAAGTRAWGLRVRTAAPQLYFGCGTKGLTSAALAWAKPWTMLAVCRRCGQPRVSTGCGVLGRASLPQSSLSSSPSRPGRLGGRKHPSA